MAPPNYPWRLKSHFRKPQKRLPFHNHHCEWLAGCISHFWDYPIAQIPFFFFGPFCNWRLPSTTEKVNWKLIKAVTVAIEKKRVKPAHESVKTPRCYLEGCVKELSVRGAAISSSQDPNLKSTVILWHYSRFSRIRTKKAELRKGFENVLFPNQWQ